MVTTTLFSIVTVFKFEFYKDAIVRSNNLSAKKTKEGVNATILFYRFVI